jgi:hypothetical protein
LANAFDGGYVASVALALVPLAASVLFVLVCSLLMVVVHARRRRAAESPPEPPAERPASPTRPRAEEARGKPRRTYNPVAVLVSDAEGTREPARGWVIDRNLRGLGLLLDEPLAEGTVLGVKACAAPEGTPWWSAEVRYCRPEEGRWVVGCKFLTCPPLSVALLFG